MSLWQKLKHLFTKNGIAEELEVQRFGCPSCKGEAVTTELEDGDKIKRCIGVTMEQPLRPSCGWSMHIHGKSMPEMVDAEGKPVPYSCPRCGCKIVNGGGVWRCHGLANRAEVEEFFRHLMPNIVPPGMETMKPCGWTGKDEDFGKVWS